MEGKAASGSSCQTQNLRNKDQSFTLGEAHLQASVSPLCEMGVTTEATSQDCWHGVTLHQQALWWFWWKNTERGVEFEEVSILPILE